MPQLSPVLAIRLAFLLNGMGVAVWFPRIPDVKAALEVDLLTLSLCFFMLPLGTMISFFFAPAVVARFGARLTCQWVGPLFVVLFGGPALATSAIGLGLCLFLAGLSVGAIEVGMNSKATEIERIGKRRIMAGCHGAWSVGSMGGALLGGAAAGLGIGFLTQQLILVPIMAALAFWAGAALPADSPAAERLRKPRLVWPKGALLAICAMPVGALMLEGAMMEWSALFLRGDVGLGAFAASVVYAAFALTMALSRFAGDRLIERFGPARIMVLSCVLAGLGIATFALSPGAWLALPAAIVLGAGIGNIYPLAMSRAGELPGATEDNIATVAVCGFTAFMIGPPLIGTLGSVAGLPVALLALTPLALYPFILLTRALGAPAPEGSANAPS